MLVQDTDRDNLSAVCLDSNRDDAAQASADTEFFTGLELLKRSSFVRSESRLTA